MVILQQIISSMVMSALAACVGAIVLSLGILDSYIQGNPIGYHDVTRDSVSKNFCPK